MRQIRRLNSTLTRELAFIQVTLRDENHHSAYEALPQLRKQQSNILKDILKQLTNAKKKANSNFQELHNHRRKNERLKSTTAPSCQIYLKQTVVDAQVIFLESYQKL